MGNFNADVEMSDLFHYLFQNRFSFYITRQASMVAVFPIFMYFMVDIGRVLAR